MQVMRKAVTVALVALCLLYTASIASAQSVGVSVNATFSPQPQLGAFSTATVTVSDAGNTTVQLSFVGVHFEWSSPTVWFIGGHSGEGAVLGTGENISYNIAVAVPANETTGTYKFYILVKYRTQTSTGNWTPETDLFWVQAVQIGTSQASSQTPQGPPETFSPETIALLVVAVGAGLFLERDSVKSLFRKQASKKPKKRTQRETRKME